MSQQLKYDDEKIPYIELGHLKVRLENEEPNDEVKEKARIELRETPNVVQPAIEEFKQMVIGKYNCVIGHYIL